MSDIARRQFHELLIVFATIGMCISSVPARADSQALMDRMLDTYINVTPAEVFETQRRGGLTFGSVSMRSRIVRPNLIAVQPPSFRGGCSGFDLIGGSFSFLNGEQLQQFLRAIAANALNYAFILALDGVCPGCMQKMEKLRDWSEQINSKLMDSCHWGEMLVNSTKPEEWFKADSTAGQVRNAVTGVVDDMYTATNSFVSRYFSDQEAGQLTSVNVVMSAMQRANMQGWFAGLGTQDLLEVAMSVTGTVVKRPREGTEVCDNDAGDEEYCLHNIPDTMNVEQFVNGSENGPVIINRCREWPACLGVTPTVTNNWPGLKSRIRQILMGPAPDSPRGLVGKYLDPVGQSFTPAEAAFIQGAPAPVISLLEGVQKYEGSVTTMAAQLAEIITIQVARNMMMEIVSNVEKTLGQSGMQMSAVMLDRISKKMQKFLVSVTYEDREFDNMVKLLGLARDTKKDIREQEPPQELKSSASAAKR